MTRSTEDVDGREQVLVALDGSGKARQAAAASVDALIAAQVALMADVDAQTAALASSGKDAEAELVELSAQRAGVQLRLDELKAQRDTLMNADYAAWVAQEYDLTRLPDVAVVERVPAQDWASRVADCLRDRGGWIVHTPSQGGWQTQYDPSEEQAFGADLYACAVMYPADLSTPAPG